MIEKSVRAGNRLAEETSQWMLSTEEIDEN
jgi:hypothetical protein